MRGRVCLFIVVWLALDATAYAQPVETLFGSPVAQNVIAGTQMVFPVYFHNPEPAPISIVLPPVLTCRLVASEETFQVTAQRIDPAETAIILVTAKGYFKSLYALDLPATLEGPVRLTAGELNAPGMVFTVDSAAPTFAETQPAPPPKEQAQSGSQADMRVFVNAYQPYAENLSYYNPMYFLLGVEPEETKFQISFKYRFLSPDKVVSQKHPWVQNFFFGYTQTSFWDLESDSRPFEDISYKPEIFYQSGNIQTGLDWLNGLFVQTGFQHESNGSSGDLSRSTNYAYIEPSLVLLDEGTFTGLRFSPRFSVFINNNDTTNPDFEDYRGYFGLRFTFGKADSLVFDSNIRFASEGTSIQVDLTYPLHRLFNDNLDLYLQVQYANALAESLLNYTERTEAVRIGIAIVR